MVINLPAGKTEDVTLWGLEHNTVHKNYNPTGPEPSNGEFTDFIQQGDIIDLHDLYFDVWEQLKKSGQSYTSETSWFYVIHYEDEDQQPPIGLGAYISYNPSEPNILHFVYQGWATDNISINYNRNYSVPNERLLFGYETVNSPDNMEYTMDYLAIWACADGYKLYNGTSPALEMRFSQPVDARVKTDSVTESASNSLGATNAPKYMYIFETPYTTNRFAYVNTEDNPADDLDRTPNPDDDYNDNDHGTPKPQVSQFIPNDGLPTTSALAAGFIKAYHLNAAQSQALADFMLTDSFLNAVKKLNLNPMDYIVGFHLIPVYATSTEAATIYVGGVDTEVGGAKITNEYVQFDCGSIDTTEMYGSFADYEPQTKCSIYIPFCGIKQLKTDDVMRARLTLTYRINVLSGAFTASLRCDTSRKLNAEIYYWAGNMAFSVPITNNDYSSKYMAMANMVMGGVQMLTGNPSGAGQAVSSMIDVVTAKPQLSRTSSLSADAGMMSNYTPFLMVERPEQAIPKNYNQLNGRVSQIGGTVSKFSGYTEFSSVDLSGIPCTDSERDEILSLLKGGVFV